MKTITIKGVDFDVKIEPNRVTLRSAPKSLFNGLTHEVMHQKRNVTDEDIKEWIETCFFGNQ